MTGSAIQRRKRRAFREHSPILGLPKTNNRNGNAYQDHSDDFCGSGHGGNSFRGSWHLVYARVRVLRFVSAIPALLAADFAETTGVLGNYG